MRSHPQQRQTTALHTPKRKKQEIACAEPPPAAPNYRIVHVKKEKAENSVCGATGEIGVAHAKKKKTKNDVCGATPSSPKLPYCTRQKEKSRK